MTSIPCDSWWTGDEQKKHGYLLTLVCKAKLFRSEIPAAHLRNRTLKKELCEMVQALCRLKLSCLGSNAGRRYAGTRPTMTVGPNVRQPT